MPRPCPRLPLPVPHAIHPAQQTMKETAATRSPLGRGVSAAEVGATAAFLASDAAAGITGQTIYVDAGFSAVL